MEQALAIYSSLSPILQIVMAVMFFVLFWEPIAEKFFGYKPKNGGEANLRETLAALSGSLELLESNHMAHLQDSISTVKQAQSDQFAMLRSIGDTQRDMIELLKDFKEYGIKCRKE